LVAKRVSVETSKADEGAFARLRASLDPCWIDEALEATGSATLRRRRLPAEHVVWLVLGRALYRGRPIDELVERLDLVLPSSGRRAMAKSTVAQAQARLGEEPQKWLFERCAEKWGHESTRRQPWRGLATYGLDSTTVRIPMPFTSRIALRIVCVPVRGLPLFLVDGYGHGHAPERSR
jgi:hypothetical protein